MRIDVYSLGDRFNEPRLKKTTAIVIDVLRATTSIVWAVQNGAEKVIPVQDVADVSRLAMRIGAQDCVLAGERAGGKLPGFDIGNSPEDYTKDAVGGKTVIISTTNGTQAIHAIQGASKLIIGALVNCTAATKCALAYKQDIVILCAGTEGKVSAEDICAAGAIVSIAEGLVPDGMSMNDMAFISRTFYKSWKNGDTDIAKTAHYSRLMELGYSRDIEFCLKQDITATVPEYVDGVIK